ncbi:MAG: thioesterase family protein [Myxococcota bacterium]
MTTSHISYSGIAHPWLCDVMNHLNTRHYMAAFDDASMLFLTKLGHDFENNELFGWADVNVVLNLKAEVPKGASFFIESTVSKIGNTSIVTTHKLHRNAGSQLCTEAKITTVYFDLTKRASAPIPESFKANANPYLLTDEVS